MPIKLGLVGAVKMADRAEALHERRKKDKVILKLSALLSNLKHRNFNNTLVIPSGLSAIAP